MIRWFLFVKVSSFFLFTWILLKTIKIKHNIHPLKYIYLYKRIYPYINNIYVYIIYNGVYWLPTQWSNGWTAEGSIALLYRNITACSNTMTWTLKGQKKCSSSTYSDLFAEIKIPYKTSIFPISYNSHGNTNITCSTHKLVVIIWFFKFWNKSNG